MRGFWRFGFGLGLGGNFRLCLGIVCGLLTWFVFDFGIYYVGK